MHGKTLNSASVMRKAGGPFFDTIEKSTIDHVPLVTEVHTVIIIARRKSKVKKGAVFRHLLRFFRLSLAIGRRV